MGQTEVGQEFARETGELTAHRWKMGTGVYLLFAGFGELVEWHVYPQRAGALVLTYMAQVLVVGMGWRALHPDTTHPRAAWITAAGNIGVCLILALYNGAVHGDMLYVLLTYVAFMTVSSMFLPWGPRFQLGLNGGIVAVYALGVAGGARVGPVPAYDYLAIAANAVLSTLGALYIDQYRRQLYAKADALRDANRSLQAANAARTALLSGLSHDMRTPVNIITGYAQMLRETPGLANELQRPVHSIQREAQELVALVDGVLDLGRLEAGRMPFQRSVFHLNEVLGPLRETTEDLLRDRETRLRWDIPLTITLDSDAGKVREIVRNLLSNAAKFTEQGEICLSAIATDGGVEVIVSDTGIGIAPEHLQEIFDPFRQLATAGGPSGAGSGFGLYLVKLLLDLLGGGITVSSTPNVGTTFRTWFPPRPLDHNR